MACGTTGCLDVHSSIDHCGACGTVCPSANGTPLCAAGTCTAICNAGFELLGGRCIALGAAPRPILPLSLGNVSLLRPTLRWQLPDNTDGALVDLCRDRACTTVIESMRAVGAFVRPTNGLPANAVVFWRLRATVGAATSETFSPTWLFHVPATDNSGGIDTSANAHLDLNGDGFDDVAVGATGASPLGRSHAGTVSLFHGSAMGFSATPVRVLEGAAADDGFGESVATASDSLTRMNEPRTLAWLLRRSIHPNHNRL